MATRKILIGLVAFENPDWRDDIKDLSKFAIGEIGLFLTTLEERKDREEMYGLLENSSVREIPHVHIRNDMGFDELKYLIKRFKTRVFNLHSQKSRAPYSMDYGRFAKKIYIENTDVTPSLRELNNFGGLCIDFTHWEFARLISLSSYEKFDELADGCSIGCGHISALAAKNNIDPSLRWSDQHHMRDLNELDYVKKYEKYLPEITSIELNNPIEELITAKKYLEKMLNL